MMPAKGVWNIGSKTAAAGTSFQRFIQPKKGLRTVITRLTYTSAGTQHTITILRPIGKTTFNGAANAGQAVATLTADPGLNLLGPNGTASQLANDGIAASDYVIYELPDGTFQFDTVSSWSSGNKQVTFTNNIPTNGVSSGGTLWFMGIETDKDPRTGLAFETIKPPVSATTIIQDIENGIAEAAGIYEPLIISVDNPTAAGTLVGASGCYAAI